MRSGLVSLAAPSTQFSRGVATCSPNQHRFTADFAARPSGYLRHAQGSTQSLARRGDETKWSRPCQQAFLRRELAARVGRRNDSTRGQSMLAVSFVATQVAK